MSDLKVRTGVVSHAGRRGHQEDACSAQQAGDRALLVVADGMGGHAAGEVASGFVVSTFRDLGNRLVRARVDEEGLQEAARLANQRILDHASAHEDAQGTGSTLVAVAIGGHECLVAHAGDSRATLVTADEVMPLTRDHSAVQEALDSGTLTEAEAATSPYRHAILRNLGDAEFPGLEVAKTEAPEGSIVLLTSDGAHGFLTDAEILEHLSGTSSLDEGLGHLLRLAYHNGSDDNLTLVGAEIGEFRRSRVPAQSPPVIDKEPPPTRRGRGSKALSLVAVVLIGLLCVLGWLLAKQLTGGGESGGTEGKHVWPVIVETPVPLETSVPLETTVAVETPLVEVNGPKWATPMPTPVPPPPHRPNPTATPEAGSVVGEDEGAQAELPTRNETRLEAPEEEPVNGEKGAEVGTDPEATPSGPEAPAEPEPSPSSEPREEPEPGPEASPVPTATEGGSP